MEIILQCICGDHESTKCRHQFTSCIENRHVITNACNWTIIVYEILHRIAKITNCLTGIYLCKQQFPFTNTFID